MTLPLGPRQSHPFRLILEYLRIFMIRWSVKHQNAKISPRKNVQDFGIRSRELSIIYGFKDFFHGPGSLRLKFFQTPYGSILSCKHFVSYLSRIPKSGKIIAFSSVGLDILPSDTHPPGSRNSSIKSVSDLGQLVRGPGHMSDQS